MKRKSKHSMKKRVLNGSLATALVLSMIPLNAFPHAAKAATTGNTATLRILETTDLHDAVMSYDYYQDTEKGVNYGLAKTASLIHQAKSEVDPSNSMLFDAGDLLQGNPMADYVAKVKPLTADETHPMFKAMKLLNYDGGIVGNHEFNYGLGFLDTAMKNAPYPIVNANIYVDDHDSDPTNDKNYFTPYQIIPKKIKDKNGVEQTVNVGIVGFAPPQIMQWDKDNLQGKVIVKDIVKTAEKYVAEMKSKGADVIVAIAHSGCDVTNEGQEDAENAVFSLSKVAGIDALLFGHAHLNFPGGKEFHEGGKLTNPDLPGLDNTKGTINGTPAVEAGYWGNNLGVLDLALVQDENGKWKADKAASKSVDMPVTATTAVDQTIVDAVQTEHEGTLAYVRGQIGETNAPMNSYFSRVMDDPTIQIVNNAQTDYVKTWIKANRPDLKDVPVISAGAPFKAGRQGAYDYTKIDKGPLSIKSANDLYLYNNTLKAVELTGAEVKEWLEMSASQFNQIDKTKADAQELINYNFQPYNFDVIDGVKYQIDVTVPARYNFTTGDVINSDSHRIINFTDMDGKPIDPAQKYIVATNNYRASGGGNFPGTKGGKATIVVDSPYENRQILMDYIKAQGVVNPTADNNWKISPINGAAKTLTFKSSPAAINVLTSTPNVKDVGPLADGSGFEQYTLDQNVHVQLLGINDFHGQLDYTTKVSNREVGGIEYLAAYLKQREATNPANTLMVQAGDLVGASRPVSALLQDEPTIRFMNEIGMDVGTIGNHEFDEGVAEMKRLIYGGEHPKTVEKYGKFEGAAFPYVVANVVDENTNELILPPYVVKEVDGVKIGFIGVVTTETPNIVTAAGVAGVKFTDETEAVNKYTAELKEKGVKAIVVLAHDPGTSAANGDNPTGRVVEMAKAIDPEVDVIYGAHDHKYLNSTVNGKLLVQSYSYGTAFSDVDLTIDPVTQDILEKKAEVASTFKDSITPDAKIKAELDKYKADIAPIVGQVIGKSAIALTRTQTPAGESSLGNLIADAMQARTKADFAFMNAGGIRDDLKKGTITWGDLFAIQPFGNDVVTLKITGEQVRTLLNQQFAADRNRIMSISGLTYTWDNKYPIGEKVVDIFLPNGQKIDPAATYTVAVNNFMADGGDGYTILKKGTDRTVLKTDLDTLIDYVKAQSRAIYAEVEGRITLLDTTAPAAPQVNAVSYEATSVTGKTEAAAKVEVKANGTLLGTATAASDGTFSVTIAAQPVGSDLVVTSTDAAGNVSAETKVTVVDAVAPEAPEVIYVTNFDTSVIGTAEPGSTVEAKVDGKVIGSADADVNGDFYIDIEAQEVGTVITVTAKDKAGNVSKAVTVTVEQYTGWYGDEDGLRYINAAGMDMTSAWLNEEGIWYYFNKDGYMVTGWVKVGTKWYFFSSEDETSGEMQTGWYKENGKWYYLDKVNGDMKVNWAHINGKWYFFDQKNGDMKTGWVQSSGKWYFLNKDGSMAVSTTVQGKYKVGRDGAWIK